MTKEDLKEYSWIMKNIYQLEEELVILRARSVNISPSTGDGIRSTIEEDKIATIVSKIIDTENLIADMIEEACNKVGKLESALRKLPEREQLLLRLRYVRCKSWEQICIDMNYSWAQIHRIHGEVLKVLDDDTK